MTCHRIRAMATSNRKEAELDVLNIDDINRFRGNFPIFKEPNEVGTYSLDGTRTYCDDNRNLRFYIKSDGNNAFNLSDGYQTFIRKDHKEEKLDGLLRWILTNRKTLLNENSENKGNTTLTTDFVCFRGLLTLLLCTPYENREGWIICATKYHGTIYLFAFETEEDIKRHQQMSDREKLMTFWGYKFEQYMTAESPQSKPTPEVPVNENEEFCSVCKSKLTTNSILYGAEVDCVAPALKDVQTTKRYIELKTSREISNGRQDRNFRRFKLLKWWAQSFLIGIPRILCGFRNDDGYIVDLRWFEIKNLPKMAKGLWDPCICFNLCNQVLNHVRKCTLKDDPRVVYKFTWSPGRNVQCEELFNSPKYQILPEWYTSQIFQ